MILATEIAALLIAGFFMAKGALNKQETLWFVSMILFLLLMILTLITAWRCA